MKRNPPHEAHLSEEHLTASAAGKLSRITTWRMRRHLSACTACRARQEQTQQVWDGLRGLASEPVPETLQNQVCGRWPQPFLRKENTSMKKRLTLLACALPLAGVTAAMAAHLITYHPSGGFGNESQMWHYTTNLKGRMTVLDTQGRKIGQFTNDGAFMTDAAGPSSAWVEISVAGEDHLVRGPGRHEIKDGKGTVLGYVVLSDVSEAEIYQEMGWPRAPHDFAEAARWSEEEAPSPGGASGVSASVTGMHGFDKALGVSWKMRGYATVKAVRPNGDMVSESTTQPLTPAIQAMLPPGFAPDPASPPEFTLTVQDKTTEETGYGRHILQDSHGKPLLILEADPSASK